MAQVQRNYRLALAGLGPLAGFWDALSEAQDLPPEVAARIRGFFGAQPPLVPQRAVALDLPAPRHAAEGHLSTGAVFNESRSIFTRLSMFDQANILSKFLA